MSLDVYLEMPGHKAESTAPKIFIREDGQTKEISRAEWNERFPDRVPVTFIPNFDEEDPVVWHGNITHNLGKMASEVGVYKALWRPGEIDITKAVQLQAHLLAGLNILMLEPDKYKKYNPENGWGTYEGLVSFVKNYLDACIKYPDADVRVSR